MWIELHAPRDGSVQRVPISLVEVRGVTGAGTPHYHDLVVVVDMSVSTRLPSGVDVDEDGVTGRSSPEITEEYWGSAAPEELCDDLGDTIAAAELTAARRLLRFLDPVRTRVGLVAFGDRGQLEAAAGSPPEQLGAALETLDGRHGWYGGTNYGDALRVATATLLAAPDGSRARRRSVLFLSDGYPTLPQPDPLPTRDAIRAAEETAAAGVRLVIFALGPEAIRGREILREMAALTDGRVTELERPGEILFELPTVDLSDVVAVELENLTTGEPARAVRLFPDGSFDGFVPLARGANRIRVTSRGAKGGVQREEREVRYEPIAEPTREVELEIERLRALLRDRTIEMELANDIRRKRDEQRRRRELRIEVEEEPAGR